MYLIIPTSKLTPKQNLVEYKNDFKTI
jgi:hypothetical protein